MKTADADDGMMMCMCSLLRQPVPVSLRAFNSRGAAAACRERYAAAFALFALYKYFIPAFIWKKGWVTNEIQSPL